MSVSFDLDDTLILRHEPAAGFEPRSRFAAAVLFAEERLRLGTRRLHRHLKAQGHEFWIYTSSLRSAGFIRRCFLSHSIWADGIVNDDRHRQALQRSRTPGQPCKFPPAFGIGLHIDDSPGVAQLGLNLGFRVLQVDPADEDWADKVLAAL